MCKDSVPAAGAAPFGGVWPGRCDRVVTLRCRLGESLMSGVGIGCAARPP